MNRDRLGRVPEGARVRLLAHYGEVIVPWLRDVPARLNAVASHHELTALEYHDWGHASVIAHGRTGDGRGIVLKAVFDERRFTEEVGALVFWRGQAVPEVILVEEDHGILGIELVEPGPGGGPRPSTEAVLVAAALTRLHRSSSAALPDGVPSLADYYADEVAGRMAERDSATGRVVDRDLVAQAAELALVLPEHGSRRLLHADLYRENVLFDPYGRVVFIDPLPKIGPPVFDWAFWSVYYDFHRGIEERLRIAIDRVGAADVLVSWCLLLIVDGLLYFLSIHDSGRVTRAQEVIEVLRSWRR